MGSGLVLPKEPKMKHWKAERSCPGTENRRSMRRRTIARCNDPTNRRTSASPRASTSVGLSAAEGAHGFESFQVNKFGTLVLQFQARVGTYPGNVLWTVVAQVAAKVDTRKSPTAGRVHTPKLKVERNEHAVHETPHTP
eukprot:1839521-Rhodomonas_salina.6